MADDEVTQSDTVEEVERNDKGDGQDFKRALTKLINFYSMENGADTPDYILAQYLCRCLHVFELAVNAREAWFGRVPRALNSGEKVG